MSSIQSITTNPNTHIQQTNVNDNPPTDFQDFKNDLQELKITLDQLQKNPDLADESWFQQKMEDVLQKFSNDYNAIPDKVKDSLPVRVSDLVLDLKVCSHPGLVSTDSSGAMEPISMNDIHDTLKDLVDPGHKVPWIPKVGDPAIEAAIKSLPA